MVVDVVVVELEPVMVVDGVVVELEPVMVVDVVVVEVLPVKGLVEEVELGVAIVYTENDSQAQCSSS